jgi:hypothetical protein
MSPYIAGGYSVIGKVKDFFKSIAEYFAFQRKLQTAIYTILKDIKAQNAEIVAELKSLRTQPVSFPVMPEGDFDLDSIQERELKAIMRQFEKEN